MLATALLTTVALADPSHRNTKDFDQLLAFVAEQYAFVGETHTDWDAVGAALAPAAAAADSRDALIAVLEDALDQLYDPHCMLNTNNDASWRPVPHGVYAEWRDGRAIVTAIEGGSAAAAAGITPGDEVLGVDGEDLATVVDLRRPRFLRSPDPAADGWALLSAVAGRHGGEHRLRVQHPDGTVDDLVLGASEPSRPQLEWDRLDGNIGRIAVHSFGDPALVEQFDAAVTALAGVDGLVIDLRSNSGGDTSVALPMLGRLLDHRAQYAWMARREGAGLGERWAEFVEPRAPTVDLPVVAVVDRFTVSMGEGLAMGIRDTERGRIVGTQMGGLGAGIARTTLRKSKISVQISAEPVYAVDGTFRSDLVPDIPVDPTVPTDGDPFLAAAIAALHGG